MRQTFRVSTIDVNLMKDAYTHLFDEHFLYDSVVTYSGHLSPYNAQILLRGNMLQAKLSKKWRSVGPEIKMGLLQDLYLRLWKHKKKNKSEMNTLYLDLYHNFVRNIHITIPKTENDPVLDDSFSRLNQRYFLGMVEKPNMMWGRYSTTKLGSYNFKTDAIVISSVFKSLAHDPALLDTVMYHEMLHKYYKYRGGAGRVCYHDATFKKAERTFEHFDAVDARLRLALRKAKRANRMASPHGVSRPMFAGLIKKWW